VRFENQTIFLLIENHPSLLQRWRCSCKSKTNSEQEVFHCLEQELLEIFDQY
jgi:hypothetical protein